ncbi:hypothetical protein ACJJTC_011412, partial [Scirpophaga incertulas]
MDPAKMKVVDLRSELGALGLDTKGNKPALVERLRKALESKTGNVIADTTILDTSTEDADEPPTPKKPAPRTTRRSSSSRFAATPAKISREVIIEKVKEEEDAIATSETVPEPEPTPKPLAEVMEIADSPKSQENEMPAQENEMSAQENEMSNVCSIDEEKNKLPPDVKEENSPEPMEVQEVSNTETPVETQEQQKVEQTQVVKIVDEEEEDEEGEIDKNPQTVNRELTEEEEWEQLNERLLLKEQERIESEKKQAEEDAKRLEELADNPVKLNRLKRKLAKKARWGNFYKTVEVTRKLLTPPAESDFFKGKKDLQPPVEPKVVEPDIDDSKITLSWYDSDLHQHLELPQLDAATTATCTKHLELPQLDAAVPLTEGAFAHAWAGCRATHGARAGRLCYEVSINARHVGNVLADDSDLHQHLELPQLDAAVPLTEGAFAHAWAGCRATHGARAGRLCYEVSINARHVGNVLADDSDLHQHLELPQLDAAVPLTEGAFAHAWAGCRATHGARAGRLCYEVSINARHVGNVLADDSDLHQHLELPQLDAAVPLTEGAFAHAWAGLPRHARRARRPPLLRAGRGGAADGGARSRTRGPAAAPRTGARAGRLCYEVSINARHVGNVLADDSDLHQHLELPQLDAAVPLTEGAFAHAWAGCRATHGARAGRLCYEVSINARHVGNVLADDSDLHQHLELPQLDAAVPLTEGAFAHAWAGCRATHGARAGRLCYEVSINARHVGNVLADDSDLHQHLELPQLDAAVPLTEGAFAHAWAGCRATHGARAGRLCYEVSINARHVGNVLADDSDLHQHLELPQLDAAVPLTEGAFAHAWAGCRATHGARAGRLCYEVSINARHVGNVLADDSDLHQHLELPQLDAAVPLTEGAFAHAWAGCRATHGARAGRLCYEVSINARHVGNVLADDSDLHQHLELPQLDAAVPLTEGAFAHAWAGCRATHGARAGRLCYEVSINARHVGNVLADDSDLHQHLELPQLDAAVPLTEGAFAHAWAGCRATHGARAGRLCYEVSINARHVGNVLADDSDLHQHLELPQLDAAVPLTEGAFAHAWAGCRATHGARAGRLCYEVSINARHVGNVLADDSDLHQHLELPQLDAAVPLTEGAFAHAWAGCRATHGARAGRLCYEVSINARHVGNVLADDSDLHQHLELPQLDAAVPLTEGAFAHAWAGCRATHGARAGRLCYEVSINARHVGNVLADDSDLHQHLELPQLDAAVPLTEGAFAHAWAGCRATHGARAGRLCYEVSINARHVGNVLADDSDLHQHLELPQLDAAVPLTEGAFAHAWAGCRATHGARAGRLCYEVSINARHVGNVLADDSDLHQHLELPQLDAAVPLTEGAFAHAWAGCRATHGARAGRLCYEVQIGALVTTTESTEKEPISSGIRVGWSTDDSTLHLGDGQFSWGYESTGRAVNNCEFKEYGQQLNEKDVIGVYLDLESTPCTISYTVNGIEKGVAFEFEKETLGDRALFPHILTKNLCYRVNFGYDKFNMLTKTKIVRKRIEVPVDQVIEEKNRIENELRRLKKEAIQRDKDRKQKERKEREDKQKKKREEREKQERERKSRDKERRDSDRKSKEAEKKDKDDEEKEKDEEGKEKDGEKEQKDVPVLEPENANTVKEDAGKEDIQMETSSGLPDEEQKEPPKENGEKDKAEAMETDEQCQPPEESKELKQDAQPETKEKAGEVTEEDILKGKMLLDKRMKFVVRYTVDEELDGDEAALLPGYTLVHQAELIPGPRQLTTKEQCEVILMVGMPGSGKTYWARQHCAKNPDKRYNILSTGALFERMKVDCKPFRASYEGRWDAMVSKCAKCVLKLLEIAKGRKRNFILDQTNVYPSAQRRKLKDFEGYRRVAIVIVTDDATYRERQRRREEADGKEVPDGAVVDMKANFTLPEKCPWLDEVIYAELGEAEARGIVEAFHKEAKAAGVGKDREKRERSGTRDGPPPKRPRDDRRHRDDRRGNREFQRDRVCITMIRR